MQMLNYKVCSNDNRIYSWKTNKTIIRITCTNLTKNSKRKLSIINQLIQKKCFKEYHKIKYHHQIKYTSIVSGYNV